MVRGALLTRVKNLFINYLYKNSDGSYKQEE